MSWEWFLGLLPLLVFLACPVMMFMMMRGGGCGMGRNDEEDASAGADKYSGDLTAEIDTLRAKLARLEAEQELKRESAWRMETSSSSNGRRTAGSRSGRPSTGERRR